MLDGGPAEHHGARLPMGGTGPAAGGAGVRGRQEFGLLLQEGFDGALGESLGGGAGHVFHGGQVHVQPRPIGSEGLASDRFSPAFGQGAEGGQIGVTQTGMCHEQPLLELRKKVRGEFPCSTYRKGAFTAKWVLDPFPNSSANRHREFTPILLGYNQPDHSLAFTRRRFRP